MNDRHVVGDGLQKYPIRPQETHLIANGNGADPWP